MRVAIIGPAYPLRGGIAHHVYYLKRQLTGRGHSVEVISFRKLYPKLFFPGTSQQDASGSVLDAHGARVLTPLNPITWLKAFRAVKAFSPQVVIFQWWHPFFAPLVGTLARAFRKSGLKCIVECHNVFPHEASPFDRLFLRFGLSAAHSFITHSAKDENELLPFASGKRIGVSALPVPNEFMGGSHHSRCGRTILFFGVVRKYKGLDVLLAAMPKVLSQIPCRLLVAGEFYDPVRRYRQLIHKYGLEQHVDIDDRYIPNEEIVELFDRADVLVLPYLRATQSAVARIALANGLPLIASRSGGLSEVVIENVNGLFFPVGDSNALADQLISYFGDNLGPLFSSNLNSAVDNGQDDLGKLVEEIVRND